MFWKITDKEYTSKICPICKKTLTRITQGNGRETEKYLVCNNGCVYCTLDFGIKDGIYDKRK